MSRRPLRLLYFVDSLGLGGANQTTVTVARQMKANGHEVWFASEGGPLGDLLRQSGIPHVAVRTRVRHPSPAAVRALVGTIRAERIDLLCPNGFDCTLDAVAAAVLTGCPALPTYGGMVSPPYPHPWLPRVNVFSQELAADLARRHGWRPGTFRNLIARIDGTRFHAGVSGGGLRAELGLGAAEPVLLMVCRQDDMKIAGVMTLLDAAPEIHQRCPAARIVLLGDGRRRPDVLSRVEEIHARAGSAFILAPGSSRRTPEAFAMADVVIANGARSALEGMACARPVISVGPNGFGGVFTPRSIESFRRFNFDKGRLVPNPVGARENLVGAVVRLLQDEPLRRRIGEFSLDYAGRHLVIQSAAAEYERVYAETVADPWGGATGRPRVAANWAATVARYYLHRVTKRLRPTPGSPGDRLGPPPPGVDPDWRSGLLENASA